MSGGRLVLGLACCGVAWVLAVGESGLPLVAHAQVSTARRVQPATEPTNLGFGRPATPAEIVAWDIDVRPDGAGLPPGRGTAADGEPTYAARCARCHGKTGEEGPNVLVGREPRDAASFARDPRVPRTIGNYWPYATTLFDYIRRAMPSDAPGSLPDSEVYGLVAYLLYLNDLIPADAVIDAASLPNVALPARDRFISDPRGGDPTSRSLRRR